MNQKTIRQALTSRATPCNGILGTHVIGIVVTQAY